MDNHHAKIVGHANKDSAEFTILGHVDNAGAEGNSSEHSMQNQQRTLQHQFFKEIMSHMQNAEEVHVTGTGTAQEQFIHYLANTPQFKNTSTTECTSNKLSDNKLLDLIRVKFK